jgi:hypothetical protein
VGVAFVPEYFTFLAVRFLYGIFGSAGSYITGYRRQFAKNDFDKIYFKIVHFFLQICFDYGTGWSE